MSLSEKIKTLLFDGGKNTCLFSITDSNVSESSEQGQNLVMVQSQDGLEAMHCLSRNGTGTVILCGSNVTAHPNLCDFIKQGRRLGMKVWLKTEAEALNTFMAEDLLKSGITGVITSIDQIISKVTLGELNIPKAAENIQNTNKKFKHAEVVSLASITLDKLQGPEELEEKYSWIPLFLKNLEYQGAHIENSFYDISDYNDDEEEENKDNLSLEQSSDNTDTNSDNSEKSQDSDNVVINEENPGIRELEELNFIVGLKEKLPCTVNRYCILDHIHYIKEHQQTFECYGGYKIFFLDCDLMLYRCRNVSEPLCHIYQFDSSQIVRDGCQACQDYFFRSVSSKIFPAVSLSDAVHSLFCGRNNRALAQACNLKMLFALWANLDSSSKLGSK